MAEWLYETGIGEARAALVDGGSIIEAAIEPDEGGPRAGAVLAARLGPAMPPAGARVSFDGGDEGLLDRVPGGVSEGATILIEVVREALPERDRAKLARVRMAPADAHARPGPDLRARIAASGVPVRVLAGHQPDALEAAGWSELIEAASSGIIDFRGGQLRLSFTPAMTLFDVDGVLAATPLAIAGAAAAGRAIRQLDIGGSIGIDLPTLSSREERQAAARALDAALPPPFERTAVNGFGFLQLIRRRVRASLPERIGGDPVGHAARALLRRAERSRGAGPRTLAAAPAVIAALKARPAWIAELERRLGAAARLQADPSLAIFAGDVVVDHP